MRGGRGSSRSPSLPVSEWGDQTAVGWKVTGGHRLKQPYAGKYNSVGSLRLLPGPALRCHSFRKPQGRCAVCLAATEKKPSEI